VTPSVTAPGDTNLSDATAGTYITQVRWKTLITARISIVS